MSAIGALARSIRRHPWTSALDATVLALAMLAGVLLALEYDLVVYWDDMSDRQRRIRVEEAFALTVLLAAGLVVFVLRRLREERRDAERRMTADAEARANRALANEDPLTALPNRRELRAALEAAISSGADDGTSHVFYLLDLNGFKRVNDDHGHAVGDEVLRAVAGRFRGVARSEDLVARLGGDEFAVLARGVGSREQAREIGDRFVAALRNEIVFAGRAYPLGVSVGVALYPEDGATVEEIMHHADLAMYKAKASKVSALRFFEALRRGEPVRERA